MTLQSHNPASRAILWLIFLVIMTGIYFFVKSIVSLNILFIFPWLAVCFLAAFLLDRRPTASPAPAAPRAPGAGAWDRAQIDFERPTGLRPAPDERQRVLEHRSKSGSKRS